MVVKFPLEMKEGILVRTISDLRENFDLEKVIGYFLDGKLLIWLESRYYDDEAEAIQSLDKNDKNLAKKICEIFNVEYTQETIVSSEEIEKRNERIKKLKQYTDDNDIIANIDCLAFNQEELAELYDKDIKKIYLCEGEFSIPKSKAELEYVIIGNPLIKGLVMKNQLVDEQNNDKETMHNSVNVLRNTMAEGIPDFFADFINTQTFGITENYIVYFNSQVDLPKFKKYYYVLLDKKTQEITNVNANYDSYYGYPEIIGSFDNTLVIKKGYQINLLNLITRIEKPLLNDLDVYGIHYRKEQLLYVNKNHELILFDIRNEEGVIIDTKVLHCTMSENNIFYSKNTSSGGLFDEYFSTLGLFAHRGQEIYTYDRNTKQSKQCCSKTFSNFKHMISINEELYIIIETEDSNNLILYSLSKNNNYEKEKIVHTIKWDCTQGIDVQYDTPYIVMIEPTYAFPLYVYYSTTSEVKKVASYCGYNISDCRYLNRKFQIIGDILYYHKKDGSDLRELYKIDLKKTYLELKVEPNYKI